MLPFNMVSQAEDRLGDLQDWIFANHLDEEYVDTNIVVADTEQNLKKLARVVGIQQSYSKWEFTANTNVDDEDKGGAKALLALQVSCARNGVMFSHKD